MPNARLLTSRLNSRTSRIFDIFNNYKGAHDHGTVTHQPFAPLMEKQLLQAALLQSRADDEPDEVKAKALVNRVLKIKEDVTRAATARASSMSDQEERAVVLSSLKALQRGDSERACRILEERLKKLTRRTEKADSDDDEPTIVPEGAPPTNSHHSHELKDPTKDMTVGDWTKVVHEVLHVTEFPQDAFDETARPPLSVDSSWTERDIHKKELQSRGFILADGVTPAEPICAAIHEVSSKINIGHFLPCINFKTVQGLRALRAAGIPPFYIWMYDEAWQLARSVWPHAEFLLGGRCVLEPTVAAYHLDPASAQRDGNSYVGTNFSLPHRSARPRRVRAQGCAPDLQGRLKSGSGSLARAYPPEAHKRLRRPAR